MKSGPAGANHSMVLRGRRGRSPLMVLPAGSDSHPDAVMARRQYLRWTPELQERFLDAVEKLGGLEMATPSRIAVLMQVLDAAAPHTVSPFSHSPLSRPIQRTSNAPC